MAKYKTIKTKDVRNSDIHKGDRLTICDVVSPDVSISDGKPYADYWLRNVIKLERPVDNCKTEYKPKDFHVGDKITYWYRDNPDKEFTKTIKSICDEYVGNEGFYMWVSADEAIFPFSQDGSPLNIVVTNIKRPTYRDVKPVDDDDWEVIGNIPAKIPDDCKTEISEDGIKFYRRKSKPCDLSRIRHGYFMLMDNATDGNHNLHKWHDNTIYLRTAMNGVVSVKHSPSGALVVDKAIDDDDLPCDTFAVKPDAGILLKTINGEM